MRNVSDKVGEDTETFISCSIIFFRKSRRIWEEVKKQFRPEHTTDDSMAQAHC